MIRIDEIYENTFWPWFRDNKPGTRVFFCDPPGHTDPEHLFNRGHDGTQETGYIFFHDQEPVDLDLYRPLFDEAFKRNADLSFQVIPGYPPNSTVWPNEEFKKQYIFHLGDPPNAASNLYSSRPDEYLNWYKLNPTRFKNLGHIIVSERGEHIEKLCAHYMWTPHYYFYHGWACQDWFRGYDKTFLIPRAQDRRPTKTFMSPNRIVGGMRDHRVLFLYNIFKQGLEDNHISAPRICPVEGVDITSIAQKYTNVYQDISAVFDQATLPRMFAGEDTQEMASYRLTNFAEAADSLVYVPTETVYFGKRLHLTEKTFKAIALEMPFVLVAPAGSLEYLRSYGFKTFGDIWDESYDTETDDICRIERVTKLLKQLNDLSVTERQKLHQACLPVVKHNFKHFYGPKFSKILWKELLDMLKELRV